MTSHRAPVDRRKRAHYGWGLSALLAALGVVLLTVGSCSSSTPPASPSASQAGVIDGESSSSVAAPSSTASTSSRSSSTSRPTTSASSSTKPRPTTSSSKARPTPTPTTSAEPSTTSQEPTSTSTPPPTTSQAPPPETTAAPAGTVKEGGVTAFNPIQVKGPILAKSQPTTLTIPAIGVTNSPVLSMGQAADGTVEVPPIDDSVSSGWYNKSPTPGELGPSIMLGHVDSAANGPSVFYNLGKLNPGDEVQVGRADGSVAVFKIDGVREYPKNDFPTRTVYGNLDHAGLRLVTCGGAFNPSVGHYESNIVAFATLVGSR